MRLTREIGPRGWLVDDKSVRRSGHASGSAGRIAHTSRRSEVSCQLLLFRLSVHGIVQVRKLPIRCGLPTAVAVIEDKVSEQCLLRPLEGRVIWRVW